MTRKHDARIELAVPVETAFQALITPSAIRAWWGACRAIVVAEPGGVWAAAWGVDEDAPEYVAAAKILTFEPPRRLALGEFVYFAHTGPLPFQANLTTEFNVEPAQQGAVLRVMQDGFPADPIADDFYAACETGWQVTLAQFKDFVESRR